MNYKKPYRLPIGEKIQSKKYLTEKQADELFSKKLIAEEKLDGTYKSFIIDNFILHTEDMLYRKTIPYIIPARYYVFDIYDLENKLILGRENKEKVFKELLNKYYDLRYRLFLSRIIAEGYFNWRKDPIELAKRPSPYTNYMMEGVVFKLAEDIKIEEAKIINAKFVNAEFYNNFSPQKIKGKNIINPNLFELTSY